MTPHLCFRLLSLALVAACLVPTAQVDAQDIHVCVDAKGVKHYQSAPCAAEQRTVSVRSYEAKPEDPALAARTAAIQQEMDRRNRSGGKTSVVRSSASRSAGPTPCQSAKAKRENTLKRVGLKRNFDLLSQLDSEVWEACKGF